LEEVIVLVQVNQVVEVPLICGLTHLVVMVPQIPVEVAVEEHIITQQIKEVTVDQVSLS
jgi:hypothetical protein